MTSVATPVQRKLPVWRTVGACYAIVSRHLGQLVRISRLWLLIMLPVYAAAHWLIWPWTTEVGRLMGGPAAWIITLLPNVIELPALASIAVAWHRLVLSGERVTAAFYLRLDRVVWWYALALFVLLAVVAAPALFAASQINSVPDDPDPDVPLLSLLAPAAVFLVAFIAACAIILLVLPRVSLILPAVALGENLSAAAAWHATRGNTWQLAWATLLCALPLIVLSVALVWYGDNGARASAVTVGTISSLITVLVVTIGITLLSLAYRYFVQRHLGSETAA